MPEGVEHTNPPNSLSLRDPVIVPLMPEGVEHWEAREFSSSIFRDRSFDAGRR